jgi:hypothetical protein
MLTVYTPLGRKVTLPIGVPDRCIYCGEKFRDPPQVDAKIDHF